jgi:hypothetical protein
MFYDSMSLLTIITRWAISFEGEMAQDNNAKMRLFKSKEVAFYTASFALELPQTFGRKTLSIQYQDNCKLPAMPSHKKWDNRLEHLSSAKNVITRGRQS